MGNQETNVRLPTQEDWDSMLAAMQETFQRIWSANLSISPAVLRLTLMGVAASVSYERRCLTPFVEQDRLFEWPGHEGGAQLPVRGWIEKSPKFSDPDFNSTIKVEK